MGGVAVEAGQPVRRGGRWGGIAAAVLAGVVLAAPADAFDARVNWSPIAQASGYRLYTRPSGAAWSAPTDLGLLQPAGDGIVHYVAAGQPLGARDFAVAAYDSGGSEGPLSNVLSVVVTATPTITSTSGPTGAATASPTPTAAISTATRTATATSTLSASATSTSSATATRTPTITATRTATASASRTASATNTPPASATNTPPASATPTRTAPPASSTLTASATPTATPSPTQGSAGSAVDGSVRYYADAGPVPAAQLAMSGPSGAAASGTDAAGAFSFPALAPASWQLRPTKQGDTQQAISPLDASHVLQAVSGKRDFDAFQTLACDVTGDGTVSTLDATRILQLSVGAIAELPAATACGSDWLFVPQPLVVPGQRLLPPALAGGSCEPGAIAYEPLQGAAPQQDFAAVLLGDCTGNWSAPASGAALQLQLTPPSVWLDPPRRLRGRRWAVPFHVGNRPTLEAFAAHLQVSAGAQLETVTVSDATSPLAAFADAGGGSTALAVALSDVMPLGKKPAVVLVFAPTSGDVAPVITLLDAAVDERPATVAAP